MSNSNATIEKTKTRDVVIINVAGQIDHDGAQELDQMIHSVIRSKGRKVVLDLNDAEYVSHKGWQVLLSHVREMSDVGGEIKFARLNPELQELFDALDFQTLARSYPTVEEAIADFG